MNRRLRPGGSMTFTAAYLQYVRDALRCLDIRAFVLAIHDASFPAVAGADTGRGSPYSAAGTRLLRFACALGFNAVQFGPQGEVSRGNASPYDSTVFSRNVLSIALDRLVEEGLLRPETLDRAGRGHTAGQPLRTQHTYAVDAHRAALTEVADTFGRQANAEARQALARFREDHRSWLASDAAYEAFAAVYGTEDFRCWSAPHLVELFNRTDALAPLQPVTIPTAQKEHLERYVLWQYLAYGQHARLRTTCRQLGLKLYGDMPIGMSLRDLWRRQSLFLPGYALGAPPSRTNPAGQPWGYPVLDPGQYLLLDGRPGPVLRFVAARTHHLLAAFDGVRIDHPHGLVCPWVYRTDLANPFVAVHTGARLFSSPDVAEHPTLAHFAIATLPDVAPDRARYADDWVCMLSPAQIERYALLFDTIVAAVQQYGASLDDVQPEVLSTLPYPLACVLQRYGLGRYRVTQKANTADPDDVYRVEQAAPADWVMLGNHDTPPIWQLVRDWKSSGQLAAQARHLTHRLAFRGDAEGTRPPVRFQHPEEVALAKFAELFVSRARQVMVFFTDLFGYTESYNIPGTIHRSRSGCQNITLAITYSYGVPCRHGNTGCLTPRHLGTNTPRSSRLYWNA